MNKVFLMAVALGLSLPCFGFTQTWTDLGDDGNKRVSEQFAAYQARESACIGKTSLKRILVTGFGKFSGADRNISGDVVAALSDSTFWPEKAELDDSPLKPKRLPTNRETSHGGVASRRVLSIDGQAMELCLVSLDVVWDLAAAIIVREAAVFQPDFILMLGRGSDITIEAGALNQAVGRSGANPNGESLGNQNHPWCGTHFCDLWQGTFILPPMDDGVKEEIDFAWDNYRLKDAIKPYVRDISFWYSIETPLSARDTNDYVCNNVSYVVANAANEVSLNLAGGKLHLEPKFSHRPEVGFLHLPSAAGTDAEQVFLWTRVVSSLIRVL